MVGFKNTFRNKIDKHFGMNTSNEKNTESRTELLLNESEELLFPLVKLLVSQGVGFPQLAARLKAVFMEAARQELLLEGAKPADASISVRSGVHRKDVRSWRESDEQPIVRKELSTADQVYTKWLSDAAYKDSEGKPKAIPVTGPAPSFDALVLSITKDFHRRTLLDELVRLGLAQEITPTGVPSEDGPWLKPIADGLVPSNDLANMLKFFSNNSRDHMAASVENIIAAQSNLPPPFIERSVFAQGLGAASVDQLGQLAKQLWQPAFQQMVDAANQRYQVDKDTVQEVSSRRMRFGVYFYSEPVKPTNDEKK
jgi:Family of unknown function (DUF6502)